MRCKSRSKFKILLLFSYITLLLAAKKEGKSGTPKKNDKNKASKGASELKKPEEKTPQSDSSAENISKPDSKESDQIVKTTTVKGGAVDKKDTETNYMLLPVGEQLVVFSITTQALGIPENTPVVPFKFNNNEVYVSVMITNKESGEVTFDKNKFFFRGNEIQVVSKIDLDEQTKTIETKYLDSKEIRKLGGLEGFLSNSGQTFKIINENPGSFYSRYYTISHQAVSSDTKSEQKPGSEPLPTQPPKNGEENPESPDKITANQEEKKKTEDKEPKDESKKEKEPKLDSPNPDQDPKSPQKGAKPAEKKKAEVEKPKKQ